MDDGASAACQTEFAGDRQAVAEEMAARLEGFSPLNLSNFVINDEAQKGAVELDPAMVRARATRLLTEGDGALSMSCEERLAPFASPLLVKFSSEAVHELLERHREAVVRSCGGPDHQGPRTWHPSRRRLRYRVAR